ncbi:ribonuclease H-like domain-containing protein [Apiospora arundinis]
MQSASGYAEDETAPPETGISNSSYPPVIFAPDDKTVVPNSLEYGNNSYTYVAKDTPTSLACRQQIIAALQLRCQTNEQLTHRKIVLPAQPTSDNAQTRLPADYMSSGTPDPARHDRRAAIAIDCEMVGVAVGSTSYFDRVDIGDTNPSRDRSELVEVCAVDAINGEILINQLVRPAGRVVDWRTEFSGASEAKLLQAQAKGTLLLHWRDARDLLLRYMDAETVLVGHSIQSDLRVLRLAHGRIVDTSIQTAAAVFGDVRRVIFPRIWGLRHLALRLLGKRIRDNGGDSSPAKTSHDCVEDTMMTRELALWCILNPAELSAWAREMRQDMAAKNAASQAK